MDRNRIILIAQNWPQTLYLADELKKAGFAVVLIHKQEHFHRLDSFLAIETLSIAALDSESILTALRKLCADGQTRWAIPLSDELIRQCWLTAPEFHSIFFPPLSAALLALIGDKALMAQRASDLGIPTPKFIHMPTPTMALEFADLHRYPVVVKGATGVGGTNVRIAANQQQLLNALQELDHDRPVVQQYIKGATILGGGLFRNGRALRLHLCEKTQLYPELTGPSIKVRSLKNVKLQAQVETLMSGLKWTGLASSDFIFDGEIFYFLELNPRPWGAITTAESVGVKLLQPFASLLQGLLVEPDLTFLPDVDSLVFPNYLDFVTDQGSILSLIVAILSISFWRSVPKSSLAIFSYFMLRKARAIIRRISNRFKLAYINATKI